VIAGVIASVALIGWVARNTRAQDGARKEPTPAPPAEDLKPAPASAPLELPPPTAPDATPFQPPLTPVAPPPIDPTAPSSAGPTNDDPERNAQTFVEQNRKVAQDELKKLKDEAERLRTRLGKVEGGIRRWEALLAALENSEKPARRAFTPLPDAPTELEPAPSAKPPSIPSSPSR
jgi:hypothetical protein